MIYLRFRFILNLEEVLYILIDLKSMEVRTLSRNNTMTSLNKKATIKTTAIKLQKKGVSEHEKENQDAEEFAYGKHHAAKYIRGTIPDKVDYKKFITLLYRGLSYSVYNLKGPSEEFIKKKRVKLPQPIEAKKKILLMDLDETLIHSIFTSEKTDVKFNFKGDEFKFNIRPYCLEFLEKMAAFYTIYVFTAGTQDYAEPIVDYLNKKNKTIHGTLHRKNCMETHNGFFIKDLRIISNRELKDIVIVDNLVHSFGLQIHNGVPILQFTNNKKDKELLGIQTLLTELHNVQDIRPALKQKLQLHKCLEIPQYQFLEFQEEKKLKPF